MYISRLALDHFRSWEQCLIDTAPGLTIFYGNNGLGKTNIVEAVEFLSTGMSHRATSAKPLIQAGQQSAHIRANVVFSSEISESSDNSDNEYKTENEQKGEHSHELSEISYAVTLSSRGAHRARINNGKSQFLRDIIGQIPSVTFAPEDQQLVSADPSVRRHFMDSAASQIFPSYFDTVQRYNHIAKQRATLLKNVAQLRNDPSQNVDMSQIFTGLEIWTAQLTTTGIELTQARRDLIEKLSEPFNRIYRHIAGEHNTIKITYVPSFDEVLGNKDNAYDDIINHYQRIYEGEVAQGRNLIGPHRDDIVFELNGMNAREYASNGEIWSIALALKMALYEVISATNKEHGDTARPILILDDVFAQLDNSRRSQIIDFAAHLTQVFITVAAKEDVPEQLLDTKLQDRVHFVDVAMLRENEQKLTQVPQLEDFMKQVENNG